MIKTWKYVALAGMLALIAVSAAQAAEPVAMVTDVKGAASIAEAGKQKPLALLSYLEPGSALRVEAGASVVITYFIKPLEFTLVGPTEATVGADGLQTTKGQPAAARSLDNRRAAAAKKFEPIQRERVALATFQMRSPKPELKALSPANTKVSGTTPDFVWSELPGVGTYRFTLSDSSGKALYKQTSSKTALQLPKAHALKYGAAYDWRVEAEIAPGEFISAATTFRVIDAARARAIAAARPHDGAAFSERLLFAARLESEGLGDEAQHAWQELAKERPDDETLKTWAER